MNKNITIISTLILGFLAGYTLATLMQPPTTGLLHPPGSVKVVRHVDTIRISSPRPAKVSAHSSTDTISLPLADNNLDSAKVEVPIATSIYSDSTYRAVVSGFHAKLDTIEVYPLRETVTIYKAEQRHRWHIGPYVGAAITKSGISPSFGIGITYSLWSF